MRLSSSDMEWLLTELAYTVERGRPLPPALHDMAASLGDSRRGAAARDLAQAMEQGASLSQAFAQQGKRWRPGLAEAAEAGERSGRLADVLRSLADGVRMERNLRGSIGHALAYPLVIGLGAVAAMLFIRLRIQPMIMSMYGGISLPVLTVIVPGLQIAVIAFLFAPLLALMLLYLVPAWIPGSGMLDGMRLSFPLVGGTLRHILLARWCGTLDMLFRAGVPESVAVRLAGEGSGNRAVRHVSREVCWELEQGRSLGEALALHSLFPPVLTWMVGTARQTGTHVDVWSAARDLHEDQAGVRAAIIGTALSLFFGLAAVAVVAVTLLSLLLPLLKTLFWWGF